MSDYRSSSITEIVRADYRTADVFKANGINFCCGGQATLEEACQLRNIEVQVLIDSLEEATRQVILSPGLQFNEWKIDFLVEYIINVHHAYLYKTIPGLGAMIQSFLNNHGKKYPELLPLKELFFELSEMLLQHNLHEEEVIFPYIRHIDLAYRKKESYGALFVKTLRKPLTSIEQEHQQISRLLTEMKALSNDYQYPENACTTHQVLFQKLREFHADMMQHKHLENNILYPKAIEIERLLLQI